jgi:hypothetical protein
MNVVWSHPATTICGDLAGGKTREYETNIVYGSIGGSTPDQAKAVVGFAINDLCPAAPPVSAGRDQASAERAVKDAYVQKVANCLGSRSEVPNVRSISWDAPGYSEETGGSGTVHDGNPHLGTTNFLAQWVVGRWDIQILAC